MKQTKIGKCIEFIPALLLHCCLSVLLIPTFVLIRYFIPAFSLISWNFTVILMLFGCIVAVFIFFSKYNFRMPRILFLLEILLIWLIIAGAFFASNYSPKKIGGSDGARYITYAYSVRTSTLPQIRKKLDLRNVWISRGIYLFYIPAKFSTFHAPEKQLAAYHRYLIVFQLIAILITAYATYSFLRFTTWKEPIARAGALLCIFCPVSYFWVLDCQSDIMGMMYLASFLALLAYLVNLFIKNAVKSSSCLIGKLTEKPKKTSSKTLLSAIKHRVSRLHIFAKKTAAAISRLIGKSAMSEKKQILKTLVSAATSNMLWYYIKIAVTFVLLVFVLIMAELVRGLGLFCLISILICNFIAMLHQIRRHRWGLIVKICMAILLLAGSYFTITSAIRHYVERSPIHRETTLSWLQFVNDDSCRVFYTQAIFAKATPAYPESEIIRRIFCSCLKKAADPRWLNGPWGPINHKFSRIIYQGDSRFSMSIYYFKKSPKVIKNLQLLFILCVIIFPVLFGIGRLCTNFQSWNQIYQIPVLFSLLTVYFLFLGQNFPYHGVLWYYFFSVVASFFFSCDWRNSNDRCCCRQLFLHVSCFLVSFGIIWATASRFCPHDFRVKDIIRRLSRAGVECREGKFHQTTGILPPALTSMTSRIMVDNLQPNHLHYCSFVFTHPRLGKKNNFALTVFDQDGKKIYYYNSNEIFFNFGRKAAPPVFSPIMTNGNGEAVFTLNIEKTGEPFPLELTFGPVEMIPDGIAGWFNI